MMDRTNQRFGAYHLTRLLGRGRFSQVYLAEQAETQQIVALKLFATVLPSQAQPRFLEEGRRFISLDHPYLLGMREVGLLEDQPFLVMDYAPQGNLRLEGGRVLRPEIVAHYVRQLAGALAHAHRVGLLHQNIKPANVFLNAQQHALLSDWGLETLQAHLEATRRDEQPEDVAYLAPEQLRGPAQPASDQYALALVAYEWLTGAPPFQGSYFTLYEQQCYAVPPSLRARVPTLSPAVEAVVLRALEKDSQRRFGSVLEFAAALEQAVFSPESLLPLASKRTGLSSEPAPSLEETGAAESLLRRLRAVWRRQD